MNDLDERIRATLHKRATASAIRTMPPGTRRRIRSRQTGSAFVAIAAAMAFSFVAFELFSTPWGGARTADGEDGGEVVVVQPPRGLDTSLDLHDVDPPAPGEWPDVTSGDLSGAYVDVSEGETASIVVDKTPIDAGRVQDEPWSLVALEQNGEGMLWSEAAPGPCGELYLGSWGDDGGELLPPTGRHGGFAGDDLDGHRLGCRPDHGLRGGGHQPGRPHPAQPRPRPHGRIA
jgi:hypothetical protein